MAEIELQFSNNNNRLEIFYCTLFTELNPIIWLGSVSETGLFLRFKVVLSFCKLCSSSTTVHRPGDDPRKECEECGNARGSNVRYYPT
jgi:hypothetical protein